MAEQPAVFTRPTAEKVLRATRSVLGVPQDRTREEPRGPGPQVTKPFIGIITGNATGGGKYYGKQIIAAGAAVSASTNLTQSDIGTLATETVLFLNLEEVGRSSHVLTELGSTPYFIGRIIGYSTEATPKLVVVGLSIQSAGCTT